MSWSVVHRHILVSFGHICGDLSFSHCRQLNLSSSVAALSLPGGVFFGTNAIDVAELDVSNLPQQLLRFGFRLHPFTALSPYLCTTELALK
jgi:hypothetical protein